MRWRTSQESLDRYHERTEKHEGLSPLIFPYRVLHSFGGFAYACPPGLLISIVGMSGGLKTSFAECVTDMWRLGDPNDGLWWGTEWTWEQMSDRAIQRYGGATLDEMMAHSIWLSEEQNDIPRERRRGKPMPEAKRRKTDEVIMELKSWPGQNHMLEEAVSDVDQLLDAMHEQIKVLREKGRDVRFCVWDYLQLLDLYKPFRSESEKMSTLMGKLQFFCFTEQVIGITASQVTKVSSARVKGKRRVEVLDAESGQNYRSDKSKLVITLNPIYKGKTLTNRGIINVAKNNAGKTGTVTVYIDPAHFQWQDRLAPDQDTDDDEMPF